MTYFSFFDRRNRSRLARVAGALYLVIILCGVWSEGIARAQLIVPGDAMATALAIAVMAYSALMEFGQSLSPGRSPSGHDLVANSLGVIAALLALEVIAVLWRRYRRKR